MLIVNKAREAAACAEANCASSFTNATNAATSATNAANSATAAAASAAAAATSETNTENLWEQFNALYLGSFAVAPTTDNEGNPLQEGALYWNSVTNAMFVWNGSAWTPVQISERYLGGFAVAPTLNNQGLPLQSGNLYWNTVSNNLWAHNGTSWVVTNFNENTPFLRQFSDTPRSLAVRTREDISSVKDWGAEGDGITNDTQAIQNAIDNGGINIFFPVGNYRVTSPLIVRSQKFIHGCGSSSSILIDHSGTGIVFEPVGAGTSNVFLSGVELQDITFTRPGTITNPGDNIWIRQCGGFRATGVISRNGSTCFRFTGGQLNSLVQCRAFVGNTSIVPNADNGLVIFEEATLSGGGFQYCYTSTINDFVGSSSGVLDACIKLKAIDGFTFSNAYLAYAKESLIWFNRQTISGYIAAINITNVYMDCTGGLSGTPIALLVSHSLPAGTDGVGGLTVSNCVMGGNSDFGTYNSLIYFSKRASHAQFSNNYIANSGPPWGVTINDSVTGPSEGKYIFNGNVFTNLSQATGGGSIYAKDVDMLSLVGNIYNNTSTSAYQVLVAGTVNTVTSIGNITDGSATEVVKISGTINRNAVILDAGQTTTNIVRLSLPTVITGLPSGSMWNNAGVVNIVP